MLHPAADGKIVNLAGVRYLAAERVEDRWEVRAYFARADFETLACCPDQPTASAELRSVVDRLRDWQARQQCRAVGLDRQPVGYSDVDRAASYDAARSASYDADRR